MIYGQIPLLLNLVFNLFNLKFGLESKYLKLAELPYEILLSISTILLIFELHKYIVVFDFITFLGFSQQFSSRFKKFTNFITYFTLINCVFFILLTFARTLVGFVNDSYYDLFANLVAISFDLRS